MVHSIYREIIGYSFHFFSLNIEFVIVNSADHDVWVFIDSQSTHLGVTRVKSCNFGYQVNSHIHLQTMEILMSRLIRSFTVRLVNTFLYSNN